MRPRPPSAVVSVGQKAAVWRIAPPLTVSKAEIERGIAIIDQAIAEVLANGRGAEAE